MKVPDLLKRLALGELSNLSMSDTGDIAEGKVPKIIMYANEGLLHLHTKFVLKQNSLLIEMRENITSYHLLKRFAYSQYDINNPPTSWNMPYILDNQDEPFQEDVIKVLSVYNYMGIKLPINDLDNACSVFTPQPLVLQVTTPVQGKMLSVEYQAKHEVIPETEYDDVDVDVPACLESALLAYIASKSFMHMNTQENTFKGQEHNATFESLCQLAVDMDLVSTAGSPTNTRFEKRGWI